MTVIDTASCAENCLIYQTYPQIGAVKSHMRSKQHDQIMKQKPSPFTQSITDFFGRANKSAPTTNKSGE